ncbi:MAG: hypothetical protein H7831_06735 [Magnetococcus sp. WYHC-3]
MDCNNIIKFITRLIAEQNTQAVRAQPTLADNLLRWYKYVGTLNQSIIDANDYDIKRILARARSFNGRDDLVQSVQKLHTTLGMLYKAIVNSDKRLWAEWKNYIANQGNLMHRAAGISPPYKQAVAAMDSAISAAPNQ